MPLLTCPLLLIHPAAWKKNSTQLIVAISGLRAGAISPRGAILGFHHRTVPHVATNGASKRSKRLRLATVRL